MSSPSEQSYKLKYDATIKKDLICIDLSDDEKPVIVKTEPGLEKKVDSPPALVEDSIKPDEAEGKETPEIVADQKSNDNMVVAPVPAVAPTSAQNAPKIKKRIAPTVIQDSEKIAALKRKMDPSMEEGPVRKLSSGQKRTAGAVDNLIKRIEEEEAKAKAKAKAEAEKAQASPTQAERQDDQMDFEPIQDPVEIPKVPEPPVDVPAPTEMQLDAAPQEKPAQPAEMKFCFWYGSEAKTLRGNLLWCAIAPCYDPNLPSMEGNKTFEAASDLVNLIGKHHKNVCDYTKGLIHFLEQGKELEATMCAVRLMILQAFGDYAKLQSVDPNGWPCLPVLNQIGIQPENYGMPESVAWVVVSLFAEKLNFEALKTKIAVWYGETQTPLNRMDWLAFAVIMICRKIDATEIFGGGDFSSLNKKEGDPFHNPYKNKVGTESSKLRAHYGWKNIDEIARCVYLERIEGKSVSEIKKPEESGEKQEKKEKKQKKEKSNKKEKSEKKDGKKKKDEQSNDNNNNNQEKPKKKKKAADMKFTLNEVARPVQKAKEDKPAKADEPELPIIPLDDDPSINEGTLVLSSGKGKQFWFPPNQDKNNQRVFLGPWGSSDDSGLKGFLRRLKMIKSLGSQNIAHPDGKLYRATSGFYICYDGIFDSPLNSKRFGIIEVGGQPRKGVIPQSGLEHLGYMEGTTDEDELLKILSPLVYDLCCAHVAKARVFLANVWVFNGKTKIVLSDSTTKNSRKAADADSTTKNPRKAADADGPAKPTKAAPVKLTARLLAFSGKNSPLETRLYAAILTENNNNALIGNIKAMTDTINDDPNFLETLPTGSKGILKKKYFDRAGELYHEIAGTSQETLEKYEMEQLAFQKKKGRKSISLGAEDSDDMSGPDEFVDDGFTIIQ